MHQILSDTDGRPGLRGEPDAVRRYLAANPGGTVAATLILDALTLHDVETDRINRTFR